MSATASLIAGEDSVVPVRSIGSWPARERSIRRGRKVARALALNASRTKALLEGPHLQGHLRPCSSTAHTGTVVPRGVEDLDRSTEGRRDGLRGHGARHTGPPAAHKLRTA